MFRRILSKVPLDLRQTTTTNHNINFDAIFFQPLKTTVVASVKTRKNKQELN